jgi:predicted CoA-binding protein
MVIRFSGREAIMSSVPDSVAAFLAAKRVAVAGVSRDRRQPANAIFRRLRDTGHEVVPVNPRAAEVEGERCYARLDAIPGEIDAVLIATHPDVAADVVRQAADRGVQLVWFHRSFGEGSVSAEALVACDTRGVRAIIGGCPLMYCGKVDLAHRCFRWWLGLRDRLPD